jgi:hypothetical protein
VVTNARRSLLVTSIGLLAFVSASKAATQPAGAAACSGAFQVDGSAVSNTATVFVGSRIDSGNAVCTVRMTSGATVKLEPQSGIVITEMGVTLTNGTVRIQGTPDLGLSAAKVVIRPAAQTTVLQARSADNQVLVNVSAGNATLVGPKSELYTRLDTGTLMRFAIAPNEPSGVYLWVLGCLHSGEENWFVTDQHIERQVALLGGTVKKNLQPVGIWGAPQPLPSNESQFAARLRIMEEVPEERACVGFARTSSLNGESSESRRKTIAAVVLALGVAAVGLGPGGLPGQSATSASIP